MCLISEMALAEKGPSLMDLLDTDLATLMEMSVVTPARKGQVASEAPASLHLVTREMIRRRGYMTLENVLQDLPGFDLATGQPAGEFPTHFLYRGIGDVGQTKVLFMVDGIVRNDLSNGWSRNVGYEFSLADVDRIEVIGGPGSSLYGANAYAGLVNVITRNPQDAAEGLSLEVNLSAGSHGTRAPEAVVHFRGKNGLAPQLAGRWFVSDGDDGDRPDPGNYFTTTSSRTRCSPPSMATSSTSATRTAAARRLPTGSGPTWTTPSCAGG